jgi:hypothetical protein
VTFDGTYFNCWFNSYNSNFFLRSSDGFTWEWIPFTQSIYGTHEFVPFLTHNDGTDDIFIMQGYNDYYPVWYMASDGDVTRWEHRTMNVNYDIPTSQSKNKIAVIPGTGMFLVGMSGSTNQEYWADFTEYDPSTIFQLPSLSNGLPGGLKKYIKMS